MENRNYPKVIVTCIDAWRDDVGANTLPNFFLDWNPENVAVVYTKAELPDSPCSNHYFQISENDVVHVSLHPGRKCGKEVHNEEVTDKKSLDFEQIVASIKEEERRYDFFRQHRWKIFYLARDILWSLGAWKSRELDQFIKNFDADVIFFPIYPYIYMNKIQTYIVQKAGVRGVAYITDDNYSYKPEWYNPLFLIQRFFLRKSINKIMQYSDELLVILPKLIDEYKNIFKVPMRVLTKGICLSNSEYLESEHTLPLKMVYTGNLFIGRDKTMFKVIDSIKKLNRDGIKVQLYIYSHIKPTEKLKRKLNVEGTSYFMGAVPISEIEQIQKKADIVLFVEAIDAINKNKARLSFSTKLTDYFKTGKCIFAVGKKETAPIDYLIKNKCAVVAETQEEISKQLKKIIEDTSVLNKYGRRAFEVGKERHSKELMTETFYSALVNASKISNGRLQKKD